MITGATKAGSGNGAGEEAPGGAQPASGIERSAATYALPMPLPPEITSPDPLAGASRGRGDWSERCARLFADLRRPARAMVTRAYGRALCDEEIEDVYSAAWAATLAALRNRGDAMSDDELRAYVFTAVASHASKELRRRSRKPASPLEEAHERAISDLHEPLPDESAINSESTRITRDLLAALPPRRRAVMLLRYGWGMAPEEVCALVSGLSPRAYRKEVTRGVQDLLERFREVESGEWCESREPILRDYVAGVAGEDAHRQAIHHLDHCRPCADLVARLSGQLHELGSTIALGSIAGVVGEPKLGLVDRISAGFERGRELLGGVSERGEAAAGPLVASGGARGSGAAGAGLVAKLAGLGAAGKTAAGCLGAGAAATACVAAGVVPGIGIGERSGAETPERSRLDAVAERAVERVDRGTISLASGVEAVTEPPLGEQGTPPSAGPGEGGKADSRAVAKEPDPEPVDAAPADSVAPTAAPVEQEFVVPLATATSGSSGTGSSSGTPSDGGTSAGAGASGSEIGQEFGP